MEPSEEQPSVSVYDTSANVKETKDDGFDHEEKDTFINELDLDKFHPINLLERLERATDKEKETKMISKELDTIRNTHNAWRYPIFFYFLKSKNIKSKELVHVLTEAAKPRLAILLKDLEIFIHEKIQFDNYQPTESDMEAMRKAGFDRVHALRQLSLAEFVKLHSKSANGKDGILFKNLITTEEFDDQDKRAQEVSKVIHERKQNEERVRLVLLDGHGRMLFLILKHLIDDFNFNVDEHLTVVLTDIDPCTNDFHDMFLPQSIQIVRGNLLDFPLTKSDVVYANFCSIPSLHDSSVKEQFASYLNKKCGLPCFKESVLYWALFVTCEKRVPLFISFVAATGPMRTQYRMVTGNETEDKKSSSESVLTALGLYHLLLDSKVFSSGPRLVANRSLMKGDKFIHSGVSISPITLKTKIQHSGVFATVYLPAAAGDMNYRECLQRLDLRLLHAGLKHHHPELAPGSTFQAIHGSASDELVTYTVVKRYLNMVDAKCDHPICKRKKTSCEKKKQWNLQDILILLDPSAPLFEMRFSSEEVKTNATTM